MRRTTHAGAARTRAYEASSPTTYLEAGTAQNAALALAAHRENQDSDEAVRLMVDLANTPMFRLAVVSYREGVRPRRGDTPEERDDREWFELRLMAARLFLAGKAAGLMEGGAA